MKIKITLLLAFLLVISCKEKNEDSKTEKQEVKTEKNILEKIADAHGYENWKNVEEIQYTFNVDRDSSHYERSWKWFPQEDKVNMMGGKDSVYYSRAKMDSIAMKADQGFINDKYWLLYPFQLVWDKGFEHQVNKGIKAPISEKNMTEVVINYNDADGYTPGDTYNVYVDEEFMIREWSYTPAGQTEPKMFTTWEDYKELNGLKIAQTHTNKEGNFKLYFTNIKVE